MHVSVLRHDTLGSSGTLLEAYLPTIGSLQLRNMPANLFMQTYTALIYNQPLCVLDLQTHVLVGCLEATGARLADSTIMEVHTTQARQAAKHVQVLQTCCVLVSIFCREVLRSQAQLL